ncbi:hypothetical protein SteCoe_3849 [Stentor coeruleus]|uniref:Calcineurin-like phosphoesterase domain-containing protein n=1 Tax=Stentor coeruleus TaxID=5963 RepID=A0A1R2CW84_9CILI|nr:hypothetical protein SteCoe_3849 [Stentor coeruleus]
MENQILISNGNLPKPPNTIRFVCISDSHSLFFNFPPGDVLLHAGDFTKKGTSEEVFQFANYLKTTNYQYKVIISGNHDSPFDTNNFDEIMRKRKNPHPCNPYAVKSLFNDFTYLEDSFVNVFGYTIWGTPWTRQHYKGAFTIKDKYKLIQKWQKIPLGIDIVLSHSPPNGILDKTKDNQHLGCSGLAEIIKMIKPKVHVFGHIHEGHGVQIIDGTTYINASVCNNRYQAIYSPIVFDLPII